MSGSSGREMVPGMGLSGLIDDALSAVSIGIPGVGSDLDAVGKPKNGCALRGRNIILMIYRTLVALSVEEELIVLSCDHFFVCVDIKCVDKCLEGISFALDSRSVGNSVVNKTVDYAYLVICLEVSEGCELLLVCGNRRDDRVENRNRALSLKSLDSSGIFTVDSLKLSVYACLCKLSVECRDYSVVLIELTYSVIDDRLVLSKLLVVLFIGTVFSASTTSYFLITFKKSLA
jgi:hypothetical protein